MTLPLPDWRLPRGVARGSWEYIQSPRVADEYDQDLAGNGMCAYDLAVLRQHLATPGVLVDLGCGTGRLLLPLAAAGHCAIGLDLSPEMLRVLGQKAAADRLSITRVQANLAELDCLADGIADYCICMFSTLGMVRGRNTRQAVLRNICRILKPGGRLILHAHNRWRSLWRPQARLWVLRNAWQALRGTAEAGDQYFEYRGIPNFFLHIYTRGELAADIRYSGLQIRAWHPLNSTNSAALRWPWLLGRLRANGWIVACQTPATR